MQLTQVQLAQPRRFRRGPAMIAISWDDEGKKETWMHLQDDDS